jgi:hypothetical protein
MLQQMLEKLGIGRSLSALAIAIGALGSWPLQSQISRKGVWDIHDAFILGSKPLQNNDDPALVVKSGTQQVFTGKSGKRSSAGITAPRMVRSFYGGPVDPGMVRSFYGGPVDPGLVSLPAHQKIGFPHRRSITVRSVSIRQGVGMCPNGFRTGVRKTVLKTP